MITYSALISACEKAGRWQLALSLLEEMHRDKVSPNTVTFNSLISACAQGVKPCLLAAAFEPLTTKLQLEQCCSRQPAVDARLQADPAILRCRGAGRQSRCPLPGHEVAAVQA